MNMRARELSGLIALMGLACQGDISSQPPVHLNQNMDFQARFEAQEANPFFADGRGMRDYVPGTVAVGALKTDDHLYRGQRPKVKKPKPDAPPPPPVDPENPPMEFVDALPPVDPAGRPLVADAAFLERGRSRYEIYCAPCHGLTGETPGIVVNRGMMQPPAYSEQRILGMPLGQLYDVVSNGVRNMPGYGDQIPVRDRWAVAAYVRVLQRRRAAPLEQVPEPEANSRGWSKK